MKTQQSKVASLILAISHSLSIQTNYVVISIYLLYIFVVTTGVTILLSLTVFLNLVAETLPQVSDAIPLLGTF